jgi:hypothetical protein
MPRYTDPTIWILLAELAITRVLNTLCESLAANLTGRRISMPLGGKSRKCMERSCLSGERSEIMLILKACSWDWHRRYIMGEGRRLALEEVEVGRKKLWKGGLLITGEVEDNGGLSGNTSEESFDHLRESDVTVKG